MGCFSSKKSIHPKSTEEVFVENAIAKHKVVVFSKTYCPYCDDVKALFKKLSVRSQYIELDLRGDGRRIQNILQQKTGASTVPRVFLNGECLGGASDVIAMHNKGELKKKLLKAGATR
ncbi:uncharacterized protein TRIADDRAFT_18842 [Trichoplax adhaerens]|uniref:Glutaredoxin domain-containing protein n=1 Tax=Trichoplax adhaerens TaxID=10228 RepID=B3RLG9_TRIAD|nr:hypothetical protein TRIADDRAFT_18842 [Trichoplax adhaerens]EDV29536.1 hypothetical protein TRIADDRAFT_18842 [Trichoplax adhaerens]|eukprot:XP_002108738.1 hypothetical protein TRIADDRAFT_18842 [Trichoplax adhaerens]